MLHAQTNINRELSLEIEDLTARKLSASSALQGKIKELALLAEERQQRIHQLEAQIRQLKYARAKLRQTAQFFDDELASSSSDGDNEESSDVESVSESLVMAARDLAPGEQLLEILIASAAFDRNVVSGNSSTFVLCDFYDFESQTTPLLMGSRPEYSFSSTFRVTVDGFFLRYLALETLALEVHQAVRGDFKLIGRALVRLSSLLRSKGVLKERTLPLKAALTQADGKTIGTLSVAIRLSCPISELWQLHLRSFPQDAQLLEHRTKAQCRPDDAASLSVEAGSTDEASEQQHPVNELQVTILGCRNLRSYAKKKGNNLARIPSSYAHYQLLGFPDAFTNIVPETAAPEYDLDCSKQGYVMEVDACLLRFFTKFRLWLTVFDDQIELDGNDSDDGMIGRCGLLLSDLAECKPVRGWFQLRDRADQPAGEVSVLIQWKNHFQMLPILGYELIDVEKMYEGPAEEFPRSAESDSAAVTARAAASRSLQIPAKPLNLDVKVLADAKLPPQTMTAPNVATRRNEAESDRVKVRATDIATNALASSATTVAAANEFQRRKQAFMDRMKAIASVSSKSLVYEELEKKQAQRRLESIVAPTTALSQWVSQTCRTDESSAPIGKQVHFQNQPVSAAGVVLKLRAQLETITDVGAALMNRLDDAGKKSRWIDQPTFALCVNQHIGSPLSPAEVRAVFDAFGDEPGRDKLDFDEFVRKTLHLPVNTRQERWLCQPAKEEEDRLHTALSFAAQQSSSAFHQAFQLFEEHCVVHRFGEVAPSVFWKQMDSSGLVELLSKKVVGLLARKFLTRGADGKERGVGEQLEREAIPLKAVHSLLRMFELTQPKSPTKKAAHEDVVSVARSPRASPRREQQQSHKNEDDDERLHHLLVSAAEHSRDAFQQALLSFQERSAAQRFIDVTPSVFWKQMEASGFAELLGKKSVGLIAQKLLAARKADATESASEAGTDSQNSDKMVISLRAVNSLLSEFAPKRSKTSAQPEESHLQQDDSAQQLQMPEALRRLLVYCSDAGIDFRGEFEKIDTQYSGRVSAMEFKQVILGLGISRFCGDTAPESVIGQLVRRFRASGHQDAVWYTSALWDAIESPPLLPGLEWYPTMSEHLRSRIRHKAGFAGRLDFRDERLYSQLDCCFAHFDRAHEGFLSAGSLLEGLTALKYELTTSQVQVLISRMGVFRIGAETLSRMEFDSFVLDPHMPGVLGKLARELLVVNGVGNGERIPRIAQLSRALLARDAGNLGALPKQAFWSCLEKALDRKLPQTTKFSLQHLFDVNRDATIAYRLFMKVVAQWQRGSEGSSSVELAAVAEEKARACAASREHKNKQSSDPEKRQELLRSLYNQLTSLDFTAQVEIVEEHLQRKDPERSGCITWRRLTRIFDQIGISLSKTASNSLLEFFSTQSDDESALDGALILYDKLLKALRRTHDDAEAEEERERDEARHEHRRK
ncbi:hypothetical protein PybrP1_008442 [[Pythium] brassicae (nom. inval.)]|nr:hypothetical protein PybrP1_008442 [[Pythium] brassicae (nom. inval.)]